MELRITRRRALLSLASLVAAPLAAEAQQAGRVYHIGVILQGGPYYAAVDGLRDGLKELGLEERKQFVLDVRDAKGDMKGRSGGEASRRAEGRFDLHGWDLGHLRCQAGD